jgi:uracil-DNA glycosylase family 4
MPSVKGNPGCTGCELHHTAKSVCLMGRGPVPAKVMVVGEAPGRREDKTGKPFVGDAGAILDKTLEKAGLKRKDVYITNVVKCRPPENRTPKNGEIRACKKYFDRELKKVNPKFVITLGATALKGVLKHGKITEMHGQVIHSGDGRVYMPTFHPAAALYDIKRLGPIREDFKTFAETINGRERKHPKLNIVQIKSWDDLERCLRYIRKNHHLSFDTETTGLHQHEPGFEVRTFQIGDDKVQFLLPLQIEGSWLLDRRDIQGMMLRRIQKECKGKWLSAQNGKFDNIALMTCYNGLKLRVKFDTGIAAHLLDENQSANLKYRARVDLGARDWDIGEDDKKASRLTKKFMRYACYDVFWTWRLAELYKKRLLATDGLWSLFTWVMMPAQDVLTYADKEGFTVNLKRRKEVRAELLAKSRKYGKKLKQYADINWNSHKQVARVLFGKLRLSPIDKTAGGAWSTSESVLKRLAHQHRVPKLLLDYRENTKLINTYIDGWKKAGHLVGNKVYFSSKIIGTVTGRLSSRLHLTPRNPLIRSLIDAPEGWEFFSADFSQIELRVAAMVSGDIALLDAFKRNVDVHLATACDMTGKPPDKITKEVRKKAKAVNFGFLYGMMPPKFVEYARDNYEVDVSVNEAKRYRNAFFNRWSSLLDWHDRQRRIVRSAGEVRNPIGRIRRLPDIGSSDWGKRSEAERQAINSPVQGFASDLKLMAMAELGRKLDRLECKMLGEHHDAILGIVRKDVTAKNLTLVKLVMESPELLKKFNVKIPVPIIAEVEVGPWGAGRKVKRFKGDRIIFEEAA